MRPPATMNVNRQARKWEIYRPRIKFQEQSESKVIWGEGCYLFFLRTESARSGHWGVWPIHRQTEFYAPMRLWCTLLHGSVRASWRIKLKQLSHNQILAADAKHLKKNHSEELLNLSLYCRFLLMAMFVVFTLIYAIGSNSQQTNLLITRLKVYSCPNWPRRIPTLTT